MLASTRRRVRLVAAAKVTTCERPSAGAVTRLEGLWSQDRLIELRRSAHRWDRLVIRRRRGGKDVLIVRSRRRRRPDLILHRDSREHRRGLRIDLTAEGAVGAHRAHDVKLALRTGAAAAVD